MKSLIDEVALETKIPKKEIRLVIKCLTNYIRYCFQNKFDFRLKYIGKFSKRKNYEGTETTKGSEKI